VQALISRYETFQRADGHTVKMPMDQGEGQRWTVKPGNFYSAPVKMHLDPASSGEIRLSVDRENPPMPTPQDTKYVKYLRVQNDRLSKFWGRPIYLGAIVLLPFGWDTHPNARYPLLVHHGHFPGTIDSDGWRETPPGAALQESLASLGVFVLRVGLVINKLPWTAGFRCERSAAPMLRQSLLQVRRETNVEAGVAFRSQYINIEHGPDGRIIRPREAKTFTRSFTEWSTYT
jgi:hypothetical protein